MNFARGHALGLIIGIVLAEVYRRQKSKGGG